MDVEEWKRMRSGSCICQDHLDQSPACPAHKRQSVSITFSALAFLFQNFMYVRFFRQFLGLNKYERVLYKVSQAQTHTTNFSMLNTMS